MTRQQRLRLAFQTCERYNRGDYEKNQAYSSNHNDSFEQGIFLQAGWGAIVPRQCINVKHESRGKVTMKVSADFQDIFRL